MQSHLRSITAVAATAVSLIAVTPAVAHVDQQLEQAGHAAKALTHHKHHAKRHHHRKHRHHHAIAAKPPIAVVKVAPKPVAKPKPQPVAKPKTKPAPKPVVNRHVPYIAYSNQTACGQPGYNPLPDMARHGANVFRLVGPDDSRLTTCATNIRNAGVRLYVSLRYEADATPAQVAAQVADALKYTGPVWAFSIGNEEDIHMPGAAGTPAAYEQVWRAAEPVLAKDDPTAIRVFGEGGPWTIKNGWLKQALADGHAGAQVASFHCYDVNAGGINLAVAGAQIAKNAGLPAWCSEMAPAANVAGRPAWTIPTTPAAWAAKVQDVVNSAPDLQMTSYYTWLQIGAAR